MGYVEASSHSVENRDIIENKLIDDGLKQPGITFPAPRKQDTAIIVRLDIIKNELSRVKEGVRELCSFLEDIQRGNFKVEEKAEDGSSIWSSLSRFEFSATIGFGRSLFRKLNVMNNCPKGLSDMPNYYKLKDQSPYILPQSDIILQLASNNYSVNLMVLQNDSYLFYIKNDEDKVKKITSNSKNQTSDIYGRIKSWAQVTDIHFGFRRSDGRNLMGFYDGISNPDRLKNDNIWFSETDNESDYSDGTYMVFQKIVHELEQWNQLSVADQEAWVGRSKATGLLLGTLSTMDEERLGSDLKSSNPAIRKHAMGRLTKLIDPQRNPDYKFFDPMDMRNMNIVKCCKKSSHVRSSNPRNSGANSHRVIFRNGYLFMEEHSSHPAKTGLLFISFQKDIKIFEEMKRNIASNLSKNSIGKSFNTLTLGGGYYLIPPIPNKSVSEIGQDFFR